MTQYLYGAAVQGIQSFIFQTNKLREIVGASELVEEICTAKFYEMLTNQKNVDAKTAQEALIKDNNAILHAAGNIKYVFDSKKDCANLVKIFPKEISKFAPGITVSQAVVEYDDPDGYKAAVTELEKRLKIQRNKPMRSQTLGFIGIERSRQTGLPVTDYRRIKKQMTLVDAATCAKIDVSKNSDNPNSEITKDLCCTAFGKEKLFAHQIAYDFDEMTDKNDWIAVIHADGNGLGAIVREIGTDRVKFKDFSENLDKSTKAAAVAAYNFVRDKKYFDENKKIPIRPIVLGGDDFTVICRADLALEYVSEFIKNFENEAEKNCKRKLTACAGISYVKSSFPFYYGYNLAEQLCTRAKKYAKKDLKENEIAKSCLMFHKVQDSFTEDNFDDISKRELTTKNGDSFEFGPYFIEDTINNKWTVNDLLNNSYELDGKEGNATKSHLRQWMSLLHDNHPGMAVQKLQRLKDIIPSKKGFVEKVTNQSPYPVYDLLSIHTINNQETK